MVRPILLGGLYAVGVLAGHNETGAGNGTSLGELHSGAYSIPAPPLPESEVAPPPATPSGPSIFGSLGSGLDSLVWGWIPKLPTSISAPAAAPASTSVWGSLFGGVPAPAPAPPAPSATSGWGSMFGGFGPKPASPAPSATGLSPAGMLTGLLTGIGTGVVAGIAGINELNGGGEGGDFFEALEEWRGSRGGSGGLEGLEGPPIAPSIEDEPYVQGPIIDDRKLWEPSVGSPFQIILASPIQVTPAVNITTRDVVSGLGADKKPKIPLLPDRVDIFDVDLWDNPTETVELMHAAGKKVICYFSAGTSEDWRPDFDQFNATDMGANLPLWKGERWLDIRSKAVWKVMQKRIELASKRGCDAIDPDNVDGYDNERGGGFKKPLTKPDAVTFVRKLSLEAKRYGMSTGLKNSAAIIRSVDDYISFAVNEECAQLQECDAYKPLLYPPAGKKAKPVFHIEYVRVQPKTNIKTVEASMRNSQHPPDLKTRSFNESSTTDAISPSIELFDISNRKWPNATTPMIRKNLCLGMPPTGVGSKMSTVIKEFNLSGWVMYCNGDTATTKTTGWKANKGKSGGSPTGNGWGAAAWARYASDPYANGEFLKPETEPQDEPDKIDPDVLSIIINGAGPALLDDGIWESDVGPINTGDFDESVGKKGAGKDWIGPMGFAEEDLAGTRRAKRFVA